ncbi:MAG: kelch repeat-containing protein [Acidobacteriota bacterium]
MSRQSLLFLAVALAWRPAEAAPPSWTPGPVAPYLDARCKYGVVYDTLRQRTVVFGGQGASMIFDDVWEYNGAAWTPGPVAPPALGPRWGHAMAFDTARGKTVVHGGYLAGQLQADTWELDGNGWAPGPRGPPALAPREGHAMAFDSARGVMVLFGGWDGRMFRNDAWHYDGTSWTPGAAAPPALGGRIEHGMCFDDGRGVSVIFGGRDYQGKDDTWEYDGTTWTQGPAAPPAMERRYALAMAYDSARGRVVLEGGEGFWTKSDTWEYDGTGWTRGPNGVQRACHGLAFDARRGVMVLFGGAQGYTSGAPMNDTWEYDGAAWVRVNADLGLAPRMEQALAYDAARRRVVLYGGSDGGSVLYADTWEYDGARWRRGPDGPMGGLKGHAMAYHGGIQRVVLFGGSAATNETWEYDGASWTLGPAAPSGLGARWDHAMAYDARRGRVVLHGGRGAGGIVGDTWELDGSQWTQGPDGPVVRHQHGMVYDRAAGHIVVFGGASAPQGARLDDTWFYDGQWTVGPQAPPLLTPRKGVAMAYDDILAVTVLFGGNDGALRNDTWRLSSAGWSPGAPPPGSLTPRIRSAMADHAAAGQLVLFGGGEISGTNETFLQVSPLRSKTRYLVGRGLGQPNENRVATFEQDGSPTGVSFLAFGAGQWGVGVAGGGIDPVAPEEIVATPGPGPGLGPQVRAFFVDGSPIAAVNFFAYGSLRYGANAVTGALDGDLSEEILTGPGPGTVFGPHVRGWNYDGSALSPISKLSFFAYGTLRYGVNAARGDVDADGFDEILTGAGPGVVFGAHVRAFDFDGTSVVDLANVNFFAFTSIRYGANLAGNDVDSDGYDEMVATPGPGPTSAHVSRFLGFGYDGVVVAALQGYDVVPFATLYGGRVGLGDVSPGLSMRDELLAGAGRDPAATSTVHAFDYVGGALHPIAATFAPFPPGFGVNVAGVASP